MGCGLRRSELVALEMEHVQTRQGHWAIVDMVGKGGHIRTVPMPQWVKDALDGWTSAAGIVKDRVLSRHQQVGQAVGRQQTVQEGRTGTHRTPRPSPHVREAVP
jgi:site-specific recombinase XerC